MKIKCDYCNNTYEDTLEKCPSCGGPNPTQKENSTSLNNPREFFVDKNNQKIDAHSWDTKGIALLVFVIFIISTIIFICTKM